MVCAGSAVSLTGAVFDYNYFDPEDLEYEKEINQIKEHVSNQERRLLLK